MSSEIRNTGEKFPIYKSLWRHVILERVSIGMSYKTLLGVDDGFGDRTPACWDYTLPRADSDSRIYAAIPGQTIIGPVLQVYIIQFLGIKGIEIQIPSTTTKERTSWGVICRRIATWRSYISMIHTTVPQVLNCYWKDLLQKTTNLVLQRCRDLASRKLMRRSSKFRRIQWTIQKKLFLSKKRSGTTFPPAKFSKDTLFKPKIKIGPEIGTSLWSTWKRNRRRCSLEIDGSKTAESISGGRRAKILGLRLAPTQIWRK